jgi:hypothetical protein
MANTFAPFGFSPCRRQDGAAWSANQTAYQILYTNTHQIFQGDVCTLLSTGYIDTLAPGVVPPLGIFNGCSYVSAAMARLAYVPYYPGGDQITNGIVTASVIDDPNVVYLVQTGYSGSGSGPATQAMVGMNAQYANGTGSTLSGQSGAYIDLTTAPAVTSTLPFRILGLVADPPGSNGADTTTQYNYVFVMWNNEFYRQLAGI